MPCGLPGIVAAGLLVTSKIPIETSFQRVRASNFGDVVGNVRRLRKLTEIAALPFLTEGGSQISRNCVAPIGGVRQLRCEVVAEQTCHVKANFRRAHGGRIGQTDRVNKRGIRENEFVCQRGRKAVSQVRAIHLRNLLRRHRRRIRNRVARIPPDTDRVKSVSSCSRPREEQLGAFVDVIVAAQTHFPTVNRKLV